MYVTSAQAGYNAVSRFRGPEAYGFDTGIRRTSSLCACFVASSRALQVRTARIDLRISPSSQVQLPTKRETETHSAKLRCR